MDGDVIRTEEISTTGAILKMAWDMNREQLAVIQNKCCSFVLYDMTYGNISYVDTKLVNPQALAWSKSSSMLAIGDSNGRVMLHHCDKESAVRFIKVHRKRIAHMAWSNSNHLVSVSDVFVVVTSLDGDQIASWELPFSSLAVSIQWADQCNHINATNELKLVMVNIGTGLVVMNRDEPMYFTFQPFYGKVVHVECVGQYVMLGFERGWVVLMSLQDCELGTELYRCRAQSQKLTSMSFDPTQSSLVATVGNDGVRVIEVDLPNVSSSRSGIAAADNEETRLPVSEMLTRRSYLLAADRVENSLEGAQVLWATRDGALLAGSRSTLMVTEESGSAHICHF
jgi:hypothetical protein